jgi:hypothetical protein
MKKTANRSEGGGNNSANIQGLAIIQAEPSDLTSGLSVRNEGYGKM